MAKRSYEPPKLKSEHVFREAVLACQIYGDYESEHGCMKQIAGVCDPTMWSWSSPGCSSIPQYNVS
jgi:hypothetical protein